jgi:NADPH-dependent glutamate synthase beta subunit-like oxidoreductase
MEYLTLQNRRNEGEHIADAEFISAQDKHVIIIGGGDTGADCLGTAHRQGAASVHQLELLPRPPDGRGDSNPGRSGRTSSACPRRTRKAASASTPSPPRSSPGTPPAA